MARDHADSAAVRERGEGAEASRRRKVMTEEFEPRAVGGCLGEVETAADRTSAPCSPASRQSVSASAVLPMPASPPISTRLPCPASAAARCSRRTPSSRSRPTNVTGVFGDEGVRMVYLASCTALAGCTLVRVPPSRNRSRRASDTRVLGAVAPHYRTSSTRSVPGVPRGESRSRGDRPPRT